MDESGDLGVSEKSSRVLVISAIVCPDEKQMDRIIKNARRNKFNKVLKGVTELKFNKSSPELRKYILSKLNETTGCYSYNSYVMKEKITSEFLKKDKTKLYNFVAGKIFGRIDLPGTMAHVFIDKSKSKAYDIKDFNHYIIDKSQIKNVGIDLKIEHLDSQSSRGIQVADFLAGALFKKLNSSDNTYMDVINPEKFPYYVNGT